MFLIDSDAFPWLKPISILLDCVLLQILSQHIQYPKVQTFVKKSAEGKQHHWTPQSSEYKFVRKVGRKKPSDSHQWHWRKAHHRGPGSGFIHPQIVTSDVEERGLKAVTFLLTKGHITYTGRWWWQVSRGKQSRTKGSRSGVWRRGRRWDAGEATGTRRLCASTRGRTAAGVWDSEGGKLGEVRTAGWSLFRVLKPSRDSGLIYHSIFYAISAR